VPRAAGKRAVAAGGELLTVCFTRSETDSGAGPVGGRCCRRTTCRGGRAGAVVFAAGLSRGISAGPFDASDLCGAGYGRGVVGRFGRGESNNSRARWRLRAESARRLARVALPRGNEGRVGCQRAARSWVWRRLFTVGLPAAAGRRWRTGRRRHLGVDCTAGQSRQWHPCASDRWEVAAPRGRARRGPELGCHAEA
jgi:hypothetical protein